MAAARPRRLTAGSNENEVGRPPSIEAVPEYERNGPAKVEVRPGLSRTINPPAKGSVEVLFGFHSFAKDASGPPNRDATTGERCFDLKGPR